METFENLQRLLPMFVQALWQKNSPLMQLPHLTESSVNYLKRVRSVPNRSLAFFSKKFFPVVIWLQWKTKRGEIHYELSLIINTETC